RDADVPVAQERRRRAGRVRRSQHERRVGGGRLCRRAGGGRQRRAGQRGVGSPFAPKSYRNDTVSRRGRIGRARKIGFVPDVKRRGLPSSSPSPWKAFNSRTSSVTPFCGKRYDAPKLK